MRFVAGIVAGIFSKLVCSATPIDGLYANLFAGYTYIPNNIYATYGDLTRSHASYHAGYDVGGAIGYKGTPMRYEGEITYLNANLNRFQINQISQTGVSGYNNALFAMANVYYDFRTVFLPLQPFIGGGIGYGFINNRLNSTGPLYSSSIHLNNNAFAYQGSAGLAFHYAENYSLTAGYRFIATSHLTNLGKSFQANLASVAITYRFDESRYK